MSYKPVLTLLFYFVFINCFAQNFSASYSFDNVTSSTGRVDSTPLPIVSGLAFSRFIAVNASGNPFGLSSSPNASGRFSFTGWPRGAINNSDVFTGAISTEQYYEVTLTPETYFTLNLDSIVFTIQRSATGIRQYAVRWSLDNYASNLNGVIAPANNTLQVVTGNIFQITDATTTAQNGSRIAFQPTTPTTSAVTFRFYGWNAEAAAGTFSIDNVKFSGSVALSPTAPVINVDASTLSFAPTLVDSLSQPLTYNVQANNLTAPLVITTSAPFSISTSANGTFTNTISIPAAQVATATAVYVKFNPDNLNTFSGNILHQSAAASTKTLTVTGDGILPNNFVFNFNSCTDAGAPGAGFNAYSVTGAQKWACTTFGQNGSNGVNMNGFSGGPVDNEDWLISPPLSLSAIGLPILRFWSRGEFVGPTLQLLVSTNYDGVSDPNLATWTDLNADFPPLTNTWTLTDGIDLSAYKSFQKVYIAFRYMSSVDLGAARWTIDNVDLTNRTQLFSAKPATLNLGEASAGTNSAALPIQLKVIGYGDVTLQAPASYQLSADNISFSSQVVISEAAARAGTIIYARFSPTTTELKVDGIIRFTGSNLDSNKVALTATSYPRSQTFDAGTYNLSFFGSNPTNTPTPQKINSQVNNIATILKRLNLDVVGVEEVSNDVALDSLVKKLPNHKAVIAKRWSYSFFTPDPNFPPQKTGFIYDTLTMKLIEAREMFTGLYDSARNGFPEKLPSYPGGAINFWAGGRLPFMATFNATINGATNRIKMIVLHAKSSTDAASYNRRIYDVRVLRDTLEAYYKTDNLIIVGDFNDRLFGSNTGSSISPYKSFVDETTNYSPLTYALDQAGRVSYIGGSALIDHIIISNELAGLNIANSTEIEDPRSYISGYGANTASDHLPVYSRFNFSASLPVTLTRFEATAQGKNVMLTWSTANEVNNQFFTVERSADNRAFREITRLSGSGTSSVNKNYRAVDSTPITGKNYYRLKQTDIDGRFTYSNVQVVNFGGALKEDLQIYPNPVTSIIKIKTSSPNAILSAIVVDVNGRILMQGKGNAEQLSRQFSGNLPKLAKGSYTLLLLNDGKKQSLKFARQ